jgi:quercetin dioxygenase-like cupin family protein
MTDLQEGKATLMVEGRPDQIMKPGDWLQVPAEVPHSVQKGNKAAREMATYVVKKEKPLGSLAWQ